MATLWRYAETVKRSEYVFKAAVDYYPRTGWWMRIEVIGGTAAEADEKLRRAVEAINATDMESPVPSPVAVEAAKEESV
jgi:hypothetical protein